MLGISWLLRGIRNEIKAVIADEKELQRKIKEMKKEQGNGR